MKNREQEFEWNEIRDIWINSSQTRDIHIRMSDFLNEVKGKASQFEKNSIKNDLATLKNSWTRFKGMVSQHEKDAIKKDIGILIRLVKKLFNLFNKRGSN